MGYYTVILKDTRSDRTKTFKGVRAVSKFAAVEQVFGDSAVNKHWVCDVVYLSKHRKNHLPADKRWTAGRSRHEVREQNRSIWAVLARGNTRSDPWHLQYQVMMDGFHNSWMEMSDRVDDAIISPMFNVLKELAAALPETEEHLTLMSNLNDVGQKLVLAQQKVKDTEHALKEAQADAAVSDHQ